MKQKTKNYLILGFLLFGITLLLFNCTFEDEVSQTPRIDFRNVKTVSFEEAVAHFNSKKIKIKNRQLGYARKGESPLELTPNWQTLKHNEIAYTDAKLTTAITDVNRDGNYESELYFININGIIRNVIFTIFKDKTDEKGNIVNARVFFNDLDGKFLDGYIIENGIFTKRYKLEITKNEQKASFFPFFIFQSTGDNDFSDFGTWCVPDGGELPGFSITLSTSNLTASGPDDGGGHSDSYNWYYANGYGSGTYSSYINGATGNTLPTGGGGGTVLTSGQITSATAAILLAMPIEPDEDGKCPEGYVLNPTTGKCDPICSGGKIYNTTTKNCECPKGLKDDGNGNCIEDCDTSKNDLKKIFPNMPDSKAETLAKIINEKGKDFGIKKNEDLWHFLAQAGHETGGFNSLNVSESTYYTTAENLATTYSKFTMDSLAAVNNSDLYYAPNYLRNSSGVANIAMCCKFGNGDVTSGDGYRYRGRGIFQLTWKDNYRAFMNWYNNNYDPDIDPVSNPDIISSDENLSVLSGLWYFKKRVIDKIPIDSLTTVKTVTKPINPRLKGLKDRKARFQKAKDSIICK